MTSKFNPNLSKIAYIKYQTLLTYKHFEENYYEM
jgi:hypothetical protein